MIGKLSALLQTKQGLLVVLVTSTVLLGAGFGFLAPAGTDAPDEVETVSPDGDAETAGESSPADDGTGNSDDVSTTEPTSSTPSTPAQTASDDASGDEADSDETDGNDTSGDNVANGNDNRGGGDDETFDLRLGVQSGRAILDVENAIPGQSGERTVSVRNAGSLDGRLDASVSITGEHENGLTEPERQVDESPSQGELGEWVEFRVSLPSDDGDGRTYLVGSADDYVSPSDIGDDSATTALSSSERRDLRIEWCVSDEAGNEIQSDSVRLAFEFTLVQS